MSPQRRQHWLIVAITSLMIGSGAAFTETIIESAIDSLLEDTSMVASFKRRGSMTILSTNEKVIQKLGATTREKIESGEIPILIKHAFIAAEDRRFYLHNGVDLWGICRALIVNLAKKDLREGGSTITQQLTRIVFLSQERSFIRKFKEAALAYKLERQLSKEEILEQYLNNVYLGAGAYGVADAAWVYFKKTPDLLTLGEAALIAGLAPAPSIYSPLANPDLAIERRALVLKKMLIEGFISQEKFITSINSDLDLKPTTPKFFISDAPFFTSWIIQQLPKVLTPEQIEAGGLTIHTSLNIDWQKQAQNIILKYAPGEMEGSIVSIEPNTGLIRVLVGGKDFRKNEFNRATQAMRSPGSTFKIFPYAAAISLGINPSTKFVDGPRCWDKYCPKNFGNKYMGIISLSDAFKTSSNTVAVHLLEKVGFNSVISIANRLGVEINTELGKYYSLAIGAYEQTVIDMTAAYAGMTNRGLYMHPTPFEEIRGPGNVLLWSHKKNNQKGVQALKAKDADTINWMLQQVVSSGTGSAAALEDRQVAGKTGTSERGRDLWFIGSIPQLTTGVWFGYDNNKPTSNSSGVAAWAWKEFMSLIKENFEILEFPRNAL